MYTVYIDFIGGMWETRSYYGDGQLAFREVSYNRDVAISLILRSIGVTRHRCKFVDISGRTDETE